MNKPALVKAIFSTLGLIGALPLFVLIIACIPQARPYLILAVMTAVLGIIIAAIGRAFYDHFNQKDED